MDRTSKGGALFLGWFFIAMACLGFIRVAFPDAFPRWLWDQTRVPTDSTQKLIFSALCLLIGLGLCRVSSKMSSDSET